MESEPFVESSSSEEYIPPEPFMDIHLDDLIIDPYLHSMVMSRTQCGKTYFICNRLWPKLKSNYDYVILVGNSCLENLPNEKKVLGRFDKLKGIDLNKIFNKSMKINRKRKEERKKPIKQLIIFDDIMGHYTTKREADHLSEFISKCRHAGIYCLFSVQDSKNSIPPTTRHQCSYFYFPSLPKIFTDRITELVCISKNEVKDLSNRTQLYEVPMVIDLGQGFTYKILKD